MEVKKLTGTIGAELLGVDLSKDLSAATIKDIRQAVLDNLVIFFRDQTLTPEQQIAFVEKFGPISTTPVYQTHPQYPQIMPVVKEVTELYNSINFILFKIWNKFLFKIVQLKL
jgi:taurine dioxygenase